MSTYCITGYWRIANHTAHWGQADLTEWLTRYDQVGHVRYALLPLATR